MDKNKKALVLYSVYMNEYSNGLESANELDIEEFRSKYLEISGYTEEPSDEELEKLQELLESEEKLVKEEYFAKATEAAAKVLNGIDLNKENDISRSVLEEKLSSIKNESVTSELEIAQNEAKIKLLEELLAE